MHAGRTTSRSAFTLVELLLVVMALGLLSTIVYVAWEAVLPRTQLNTAVRELAATLQETRSDAISRGLPFTLEYYFDADEHHPRGYRVMTPFRAGGEGGVAAWDEERLTTPWKPLPANIEFRSITINGIAFTTGRCEVEFDPRGSASDHSIVLAQKGRDYENLYTVEVQALTGLISFHDGEFLRQAPRDQEFE